ncbi:MAG: YbgC/FadM family acyl-CoA thioesterase [Acidiferrobacterales bacterium]|nr:YbgC/FadM family acyl-CoA thioesterase [Acidiferrobacterales bacterium]
MSCTDFVSKFRVYYEDTDAAGVVYHANYLKFMERARTEWLASLGCLPQQPADRWGVIFAVRSVTMEFVKPARLGNILEVTVTPERIRGASMDILQKVVNDQQTLVRGSFRIACIDAIRFGVCRIPTDLVKRIQL